MTSSSSEESDCGKCTYCGKETNELTEFYPHEAGCYCIFMQRFKTDYACDDCAYKKCELCGEKQIRFAFIECKKCDKVHCYNNTDMKYEGNPCLAKIKLCDARHCVQDDDDNSS